MKTRNLKQEDVHNVKSQNNANSKLDKKEEKFRKRLETAYQITIAILAIITAITTLYCPPLAVAAGVALALMAGMHYYDEKHGYKLSHMMEKKILKFTHALKESISHLVKFGDTLTYTNDEMVLKTIRSGKLHKQINDKLQKIELNNLQKVNVEKLNVKKLKNTITSFNNRVSNQPYLSSNRSTLFKQSSRVELRNNMEDKQVKRVHTLGR